MLGGVSFPGKLSHRVITLTIATQSKQGHPGWDQALLTVYPVFKPTWCCPCAPQSTVPEHPPPNSSLPPHTPDPAVLVAPLHIQRQTHCDAHMAVEPCLGLVLFSSSTSTLPGQLSLSHYPHHYPRIRAPAAKRRSCLSNRSRVKVQGLTGIPSVQPQPRAEAVVSDRPDPAADPCPGL